MAAPQRSLATDLFEDMSRKVAEASKSGLQEDGEDSKLVEEIESLCMNCHEDVSFLPFESRTEIAC